RRLRPPRIGLQEKALGRTDSPAPAVIAELRSAPIHDRTSVLVVGSVRFIQSECKSALTRVQGMPFQWSLTPYRGCMHGCAYCYARDYFRRMDRDPGAGFDRVIEVKTNF